jgi:hypothetical protein
MARALEKQRQQAQEEARQLLKELEGQVAGEEQQQGTAGGAGRLRFGSGAAQQQALPSDE